MPPSINSSAGRLIYVLSPAKTLDLTLSTVKQCSRPKLLKDAHQMVQSLQKLSQAKLKSLLSVSDAIAKLNYERYQEFDCDTASQKKPTEKLKQALLAFDGPAYKGLNAIKLSEKDLEYAQDHLRILCGLYGILRPLDLIQAYRLEMGQSFTNSRGKDLYSFWGTQLAEEINTSFNDMKTQKILVNVASKEYFKSIPLDHLDQDIQVVECVFKDEGKIKSVYAKRARGLMCRYLIQNRIDTLEGIKKFNLEGYTFSKKESTEKILLFNRTKQQLLTAQQEQQAAKKKQESINSPKPPPKKQRTK